mgnify:FL=1
MELFRDLIDDKLLQLNDGSLIFGKPLDKLPAGHSLIPLHLAQPLYQQHQRHAVISTLLQLLNLLIQLSVVEFIIGLVKFAAVK